MINNAVLQLHFRRQHPAFVDIFVNGIAAGVHDAGNQHLVAHLEGADFFFAERSIELNHDVTSA